jgi:hypothetical protein
MLIAFEFDVAALGFKTNLFVAHGVKKVGQHCCRARQTLYAFCVLTAHGLAGLKLYDGVRATTQSRLLYAAPAEDNRIMHFFATSHGKEPCDGVGGTVKRLAAQARLQRPYNNQRMTPRQLYEFENAEIKNITFHFATVCEHDREAKLLEARFAMSRTIPGTHRLHSFRPVTNEEIEVRDFSASPNMRTECISTQKRNDSMLLPKYLDFADLQGYVTAEYDGKWWLACIVRIFVETGEN